VLAALLVHVVALDRAELSGPAGRTRATSALALVADALATDGRPGAQLAAARVLALLVCASALFRSLSLPPTLPRNTIACAHAHCLFVSLTFLPSVAMLTF